MSMNTASQNNPKKFFNMTLGSRDYIEYSERGLFLRPSRFSSYNNTNSYVDIIRKDFESVVKRIEDCLTHGIRDKDYMQDHNADNIIEAIKNFDRIGINCNRLVSLIDKLTWFVGGDPDRIKAFQNALNHLGCGHLETDGVFGPETYEAAEKFKFEFKTGQHIENGDWEADGFYAESKIFDFSRGLDLLKTETGLVKFGPKKKTSEAELGVWTANARAGASVDYVGASIGARVASLEGVVKFPTSYGTIVFGVSVDFLGLGFNSEFDRKKGRLKKGCTKWFGGSVIIGFEPN